MTLRIISGLFKGRKINIPHHLKKGPTLQKVRESLFNICQTRTPGSVVLDLFAGSGSIGIEAFSRGAQKVIFVDKSKIATKCITNNLRQLGVYESCDVILGEVNKTLTILKQRGILFDLIFLDPFYEEAEHIVPITLSTIVELNLAKKGAWIFVDSDLSLFKKKSLETFEGLMFIGTRSVGRSHLIHFEVT